MGSIGEQIRARERRRRVLLVAAASVGLVLGAMTAVSISRSDTPNASPAIHHFVASWNDDEIERAAYDGLSGKRVAKAYGAIVASMGDAPVEVSVDKVEEKDDGSATSDLTVTWRLPDQEWSYETRADLVLEDDRWLIRWSPQLVHPDIGSRERLVYRRVTPERGRILGLEGRVLVKDRPVVHVGVEPRGVEDIEQLMAVLSETLDIDPVALKQRVKQADPTDFVSVITLRRSHYSEVEERVYPLEGTRFIEDQLPLAPSREFARAFLGTAGPVTAELINESKGRYVVGDIAGITGLQREFDRVLRGEPGYIVEIDGENNSETLIEVPPQPGRPVTTSLGPRVQKAAEEALAGETHPSALVAIRISDGRVLALANGPGGGSYDSARLGRYPPGSTFKVVTTMSLHERGLDPAEIVDCPAKTVVDGKEFGNAEDHVLGPVPFSTNFAQSCNTAFVELSSLLKPGDLSEAASMAGVGMDWSPGIAAFTGDAPRNTDSVDLAAASIGQGRVLISPLGMADLAATIARGKWMQPTLVERPSPGDMPQIPPLPTTMTEVLQSLMRQVVTEGTGESLKGVPGAPVYGKSGTAEYGTEVPPRTHAWFMGYQGDIAFAVLVSETEDSFGGEVAAPIAADFLSLIPGA